ncbi:Uncharacterised protein [Klebsiella pneumoniae]|uniref:Uncharacterized protein n=1 Tax=Klebsiella pneumoniae TaxID=573 RepID=A0A2X3EQD0_KLEPN|nr:Uncharacterised protein [Klebsiella pneumoniae]
MNIHIDVNHMDQLFTCMFVATHICPFHRMFFGNSMLGHRKSFISTTAEFNYDVGNSWFFYILDNITTTLPTC